LLLELLISLRPRQWTKNTLIFLALVFSVNQAWSPFDLPNALRLLALSTAAFVVFGLVTSAQYLINDLLDIERDRLHPVKRKRPLPSGRLSPAVAVAAVVVILAVALPAGFFLEPRFGAVTLLYFAAMVGYSTVLKHVVLLDVFTIAAGFVLRAVAGAFVIQVRISPWLYIVTILGALFLGFSKRRNELVVMEEGAAGHRPVLQEYTKELIDSILVIVTSSTVMAYSLYTFTAEGLPANHAMMATVPFVLYGIFRYLYIVYVRGAGGSPEDELLRDRPLLLCVVAWLATAAAILIVYR
jgi:4-hydroxybenzoate polyprenyltransferase